MRPQSRALASWRDAREFERSTANQLRRRYWLKAHGLCIGTLVLGIMWSVSHLQMVAGNELLAVRYLTTLLTGYVAYLLLLRLWARSLLNGDSTGNWDMAGDMGGFDLPSIRAEPIGDAAAAPVVPFSSGGGGDFGGGGATADWEDGSASADILSEGAATAVDAVGSSDEGAVVVVPLLAVFLIGLAVLGGTGSLLLLYFGHEALLAVAVEVAFAYAAGRASTRVVQEGWASAAVRLTWKPMFGALACALVLGATLDYFLPEARSLPHAVQLIRG